jgi:hypothetical protein
MVGWTMSSKLFLADGELGSRLQVPSKKRRRRHRPLGLCWCKLPMSTHLDAGHHHYLDIRFASECLYHQFQKSLVMLYEVGHSSVMILLLSSKKSNLKNRREILCFQFVCLEFRVEPQWLEDPHDILLSRLEVFASLCFWLSWNWHKMFNIWFCLI